jgi:hypothetical protein
MPLINTSQIEGGVLTDETLALIKQTLVNPQFAGFGLAVSQPLTAHAGGTQAGLQLGPGISLITTVATGGDSVVLPKAIAGSILVIVNAAAANACDVFPYLGDFIDALAVNAFFALAANKASIWIAVSGSASVAGTWASLVTA